MYQYIIQSLISQLVVAIMEGKTKHVIHLYEFPYQSINQKQLSNLILEKLDPYFNGNRPEISFRGRPHKYWALFEIQPDIALKLTQLKTVQIGNCNVHIGRYYYEYQIFINKLDKSISKQQVINYFKQFGQVEDIVINQPVQKRNQNINHAYIKMKDQKVIDRIVLGRVHKIEGKEVRPVRTFGFNEDKENDKKLFLKIQGVIDSVQDLQQKAIDFFMEFGKIRERPKIEGTKSIQKNKMIVTYTSPKSAQNAMNEFSNSKLVKQYRDKNLILTLSYFHTKQNKIFISNLKEGNSNVLRQKFQIFGQINEITVNNTKFNTFTAVIGYVNENDFKKALAASLQQPKIRALFNGKPYVTIFMTNQEKKQYNQIKKKGVEPFKGNNMPNMMNVFRQNPMMPMQPLMNPNMMSNQPPMFMQNPQIPIQMGPNMGAPGMHFNQPGPLPPNFPIMKTIPQPKIN